MSPIFENAMQWLNAGEIGAPAAIDPARQEPNEALDRRAKAFRAVFRTGLGELVLQTILEVSLFRSPVDHRLKGEEYLRYAQLREGQNQLAATILAYIDHAKTLEQTDDATRSPDSHGSADASAGDAASDAFDAWAGPIPYAGGAADLAGRTGDAWDTAVR